MKLWALRCGDLRTDVAGLVAGSSRGVIGDVPVMCFAVDTGDGVLLFDTGLHESCCGAGAAAHFGAMWTLFEIRCPRHALVDERLRQVGHATDEVRWVVNSHLPGHQAMHVAFPDGASYVCVADAAYTLEAVIEHRPTGRPTDVDAATASLRRITALDAQILTAHDIDQWSSVPEVALLHSA